MKQVVKLNEAELYEIVSESVKGVLEEGILRNAIATAGTATKNSLAHGGLSGARDFLSFLGFDSDDSDLEKIKKILNKGNYDNNNYYQNNNQQQYTQQQQNNNRRNNTRR